MVSGLTQIQAGHMNKPELIIFDCDGVLVDSEFLGIKLAISLFSQQGAEISFEEFTAGYSGLAWNDLIEKVRTEKGVAIPVDISQQFYPQLLSSFADNLRRIDGSWQVISQITTPKCICSNSAKDHVEYVLTLTGLKPLFTTDIFSAVDLGPGRAKPQPDIFLYAADKLQAQPANTLVIEDSLHGVMAAKAAGMFVIGFTGGAHTYPGHRQTLLSGGADKVVSSMYQLPEEIAVFASGG